MNEQIFDQYYIDFWKEELLGPKLYRDINLIIQFGKLTDKSRVLELGSGIGRISNALSDKGISIVGIDRSENAINVANLDKGNSDCRFITSDWRNIELKETFDCVLFWGTTLCAGYNSDLESLQIAYSYLSKKGCLLIETRHWDRTNRQFYNTSVRNCEKGKLIENHSYNPVTGIQTNHEHFSINGKWIIRDYQLRRYSFSELREMCLQVGFTMIEGFDEKGLVLSDQSERAILRAYIV